MDLDEWLRRNSQYKNAPVDKDAEALDRLMRVPGEPRRKKRSQKNPRPEPTTHYRRQKVAAESLVEYVDPELVEVRTQELDDQDRWTTSEYWKDHFRVPTKQNGWR